MFALTGCEMLKITHGDRTVGTRDRMTRRLPSTVKHDLNREPVINSAAWMCETYDGVVQLSGFVDTE